MADATMDQLSEEEEPELCINPGLFRDFYGFGPTGDKPSAYLCVLSKMPEPQDKKIYASLKGGKSARAEQLDKLFDSNAALKRRIIAFRRRAIKEWNEKRRAEADAATRTVDATPRTDPDARRKDMAKNAKTPRPRRVEWTDAENEKATELFAEGNRDAKAFARDLSKALNGSKTEPQCEIKFRWLTRVKAAEQPQQLYAFAYDKNDPKQHSKALIAALPKKLQTLEQGEIKRLWEKEVEGKGKDAAIEFLKGARDRVWNVNLGVNTVSEMIDMLSRARLHPKFLELTPEPPLRNTKAFQKIFDQLLLRSNNEKKHRGAMLNLVTGQTNKCDWGFLNPGEQRSDRALRQEMSNKACLLVALAEGADPRTQLPKGREMADIKTMSIYPPFEAVASDANHATCPSYARQFRCATRGAFVLTHTRQEGFSWRILYSLVSHRSALLDL